MIDAIFIFALIATFVGGIMAGWGFTRKFSKVKSPNKRFAVLHIKWKEETTFISSVLDICTNSAYQQIIGIGPAVLPLILDELRKEPDHWFWALKSITGKSPVLEEHSGNIELMAEDWLKWGETHVNK